MNDTQKQRLIFLRNLGTFTRDEAQEYHELLKLEELEAVATPPPQEEVVEEVKKKPAKEKEPEVKAVGAVEEEESLAEVIKKLKVSEGVE